MPIQFLINGEQYEDPLNWRDFTIKLQLDKTINAVITTYDINLELGGDAYSYLTDIRKFGSYCDPIPVMMKYSCNGSSYFNLVEGNIFITECKFDLKRCIVSTKIFDKTFSSYINTNKNVKYITDSVFTKDLVPMVPPVITPLQMFIPKNGITSLNLVYGIKVFEYFKKLIEFISNGTVQFQSSFFQNDSIGKQHIITSGLSLRNNIVSPFTCSFVDIFELFRSKYNLGMAFQIINGQPTVIIEKVSLLNEDSRSTKINEVDEVILNYDVQQLFNRIQLGNGNFLEQFQSSNPNVFLQFPQSRFRGFRDESFFVVGQCNIDNAYDALNETEIVICPNIIEDTFVNNNTSYDLNVFVIQTENIDTTPAAKKTDPYSIFQTVYNGGLINSVSCFNAIGGIPNSEISTNTGYPSGDLFFLTEMNLPLPFNTPCSAIDPPILAWPMLMPGPVGLIEFGNNAFYTELNDGKNLPFGDVVTDVGLNFNSSLFRFVAPNVCNMSFKVRLNLRKDPCAVAFQLIVIRIVLRVYDAGGNIAFTLVGNSVTYNALLAPLNFQLEQIFQLLPLEPGFSVGVDVLANKVTDDDAALYFQETINDFGVDFYSDFTPVINIGVANNTLPLYDPASRRTLSYEFEQPLSFEQVQLILNSPQKRIDFTYGFTQLQNGSGFIDTVQINNLDKFETNFKLLTNQ
jgi:hypothetical protein